MARIALWARGSARVALAAALEGHALLDALRDAPDVLVWHEDSPHATLDAAAQDELLRRHGEGMGLVLLSGAVFSRAAQQMLGLAPGPDRVCTGIERVWVVDAAHELTRGLPAYIDVPNDGTWRAAAGHGPIDHLFCVSMFGGRDMVRSAFAFERGGRTLCLTIGDESGSCYALPPVRSLLLGAVRWAARPEPISTEQGEAST